MDRSNPFTVDEPVWRESVYVKRANESSTVESQLLSFCLEREFAYIHGPRHMGKSSLIAHIVHSASSLEHMEIRSVIVNLSKLGKSVV